MRYIPIINRRNDIVSVAYVDDDDYAHLSIHRWSLHPGGYAQRRHKTGISLMHRDVLGLSKGEQADHINRSKLDNQKCNLRKCTQAQNNYNRKSRVSSSGHTGVHIDPRGNGRYSARIKVKGKNLLLIYTTDLGAAIEARAKAVKIYAGEFAPTT